MAAALRSTRDDLLAFSAFPLEHWRKLWSTNPLERLHREIKRRCDVVGVFPNDSSIDRLVTAVIVEQHDEWAVAERRYLWAALPAGVDETIRSLIAKRRRRPVSEARMAAQLAAHFPSMSAAWLVSTKG